jgi:hypothetical protein
MFQAERSGKARSRAMYYTYRNYPCRYWDFVWYPCTVCLSWMSPT